MAEVVEIDIPGIGKVEAKNAATEATLKELLNVMQGLQKSGDKNHKEQLKASKSTGGSKSGPDDVDMKKFNQQTKSGAKDMSQMTGAMRKSKEEWGKGAKAVRFASQAMGEFEVAAQHGARMADLLTTKMGQMTYTITNTIKEISNIGNDLNSAASALDRIPVVGGVLSTVLGAAVGAATGVTDAFMKASSVGAVFGGSVNDMSRAASAAGMTLSDFAGMLAENGENLMLLGGTTEQGAKRFSELTKTMRASGVNDELMRMGYSTKDINQGIMNYASTMAKTGQLQKMSTSQIAAESGKYMKQIDALARATGQQREEVQRQADALKANAKVQTALAQIEDPEQRRKMEAYILSFPKEAQGAIADMISTGNMTTEEAVKLGVMLPGVAKDAMQFGRTLANGGKINDQIINQSLNNAQREGQAALKNQKTLGLYADEFGNSILAAGGLASRGQDAYLKSLEDQKKATEKANMAEEVNKAKEELSKISNEFTLFLANSGAIHTLMSAFQAFTTFAQAVLMPAFSLLSIAINTLTPIIANTLIPPFQILGSWIADAIVPIFTQAYEIISSTVGAIFDFFGITSAATGGMEVFEDVLYAVSDFVADNLEPILGVLAFTAIPMLIGKFSAMAMATKAMTMNAWSNVKGLFAMSIPMIKFVAIGAVLYAAFKGLQWIVNAVSERFEDVKDTMGIVFSYIKTAMFTAFKGILWLINKIPGFRGDFDDAIAGLDEKLKAESDERAAAEQRKTDRATKREQQAKAEKDAEEAKAAEKDAKRKEREDQRAARAAEREERRNQRKHNKEMKNIEEKKEAEASGGAAGIDYSDPVKMLGSFANRENSKLIEKPTATARAPGAAPGAAGAPTATGPGSADMASYLKTIALIESGGDPNAKAKTSSASGMFQFTEGTWKQMVKEMGKDYSLQDRFDPKKAEEVAAYFSSKQKGQLEKGIGRQASSTDLYMSHFLGAGGATKFLNAMGRDPKQSAAALDPAAAKANRNIYYDKEGRERSVEEVYALMDQKVKKAEAAVASGKVNAAVSNIGNNMGSTGNIALAQGRPGSAAQAVLATGSPTSASAASPSGIEKSFQTLVTNGINPTTIAFQDLNKKAIAPMMAAGMKISKLPIVSGKPVQEGPGIIEKIKTALGSGSKELKGQAQPKGPIPQRVDPAVEAQAKKLAVGTPAQEKIKEQMALSMAVKESAERAAKRAESKAQFATNDRVKQHYLTEAENARGEAALQEAKIKKFESQLAEISTTKNTAKVPTGSQVQQAVKTEQAATNQSDAETARLASANAKAAPKAPEINTASQETPESLLSSLNMKMDELIKINREQKDIGSRSLDVQKNNSGDLFA
jgi:hypothetical protein